MSQCILVIEDKLKWQELLTSILQDEGYKFEVANNYIEALGKIQHQDFGVLIVDLRLSDSDESNRKGMDLLTYAYERQIPSIIVTGYGTPELADEAYSQYGVCDFIPKDNFDTDRFRESIKRALLHSQKRQQPEILTPDQKRKFDEIIQKILSGTRIDFQ